MIITHVPENYRDLGIVMDDPMHVIGKSFPDFLVIGPWRTGTTWLAAMMRGHQALFITDPKETHYFSHLTGQHKLQVPKEFSWYLDHFNQEVSNVHRLMGEGSATYAARLNVEVIRFIYAINPGIKIIFGIRHPIDRAWSHAKMNIKLQPLEFQSISEKERGEHSVSKKYIIDAGMYSKLIDKWRSVIPETQFYIFEFDQLQEDPVSAFAGVCNFLDVNNESVNIPSLVNLIGRVAETDPKPMPHEIYLRLTRTYHEEIKTLGDRYNIQFKESDVEIEWQPPVILMNRMAPGDTETFIANHIRYLQAYTISLAEYRPLGVAVHPFQIRSIIRWLRAKGNMRRLYKDLSALNTTILIEYGTNAALALLALRRLRNKIVVHFHGYDAHQKKVVEENIEAYREVFRIARAIVVVSESMRKALVEMGADPEKLHHIVNGVDIQQFRLTDVSRNPPVFFACGRFVEKKSPDLTIRAFHKAWLQKPAITLRMAGGGALWDMCRDLTDALGLQDHVKFLGVIDHLSVAKEMMSCRAFVQHSVVASDGDSEGTPMSILEAGCCGVPVIATRHAGIADVVVDGKTGMLCEEHDIDAMATAIIFLAEHPEYASQLGKQAYNYVSANYSLEHSIKKLRKLL